uniref:amidohydrolase n=1 Tax=Ndongobacter massiliensis TaxID=1871025 RepID=UPI0009308E3B|nr:amidohydrolase [Ndongobacter massiliensis]
MNLLFENVTIVTMDESHTIFPKGHVRIEGNRIVEVSDRPHAAPRGARRIDATGRVLMPGLINCHTHSAMSLLRNYGNDVALQSWLEDYMWPMEAHLDAEAIATGAMLNCCEMIETGTTSFVDMYYEMDAVARVVEACGMRALLARGMTGPDDGTRIREQRALYRDWHGKADGRIEVMIGPHAIYTNDLASLRAQTELGKELGCGFHIHLNETEKEIEDCLATYGKPPILIFDELGMLDERTIGAHCVWLSEEEIDCLAERHANCCYNPASNMKLASGFMPVQALLDRGINVCIGTDGAASNNRQDLLADMHLGSLIAKGSSRNPLAVTARTMLEMATVNGAKALGKKDELGVIAPGKLADLILVDFRNAHHTPCNDIEAALVYSTTGSDVTWSVVNGKVLMEERALQTMDADQVRQKAQAVWAHLQKQEAGRECRD